MSLRSLPITCSVLVVAAALAFAETEPGFAYLQAEQVEFRPVPDRPGLEFAVLAGDPAKPGPYVMRAKFGAGVTTPPHHHDQDRFVSVVSGTWAFGMGESGTCRGTIPLRAGAFAVHPAGAVHYDGSCGDEEVVVQITGIGPVNTHWLARGDPQ